MLPVRLLIIMSVLCGSLATATVAARHAPDLLPEQYNCLQVQGYTLSLDRHRTTLDWVDLEAARFSPDHRYYFRFEHRRVPREQGRDMRIVVVDTHTNTKTTIAYTRYSWQLPDIDWLPERSVLLFQDAHAPTPNVRLFGPDGTVLSTYIAADAHSGPEHIGFAANGDVLLSETRRLPNRYIRMPVDGGEPQVIDNTALSTGLQPEAIFMSPTTARLAIKQDVWAYVVDLDSGAQHALPIEPPIRHPATALRIHWSPDGTQFMVVFMTQQDAPGYPGRWGAVKVFAWDDAGFREHTTILTPIGTMDLLRQHYALWSPDGQSIDYLTWVTNPNGSGHYNLMRHDIATTTANVLLERVQRWSTDDHFQLVQHGQEGAMWLSRLTATGVQRLLDDRQEPFQFATLLPNGRGAVLTTTEAPAQLGVGGRLVLFDDHGHMAYPPPLDDRPRTIVGAPSVNWHLLRVGTAPGVTFELVHAITGQVIVLPADVVTRVVAPPIDDAQEVRANILTTQDPAVFTLRTRDVGLVYNHGRWAEFPNAEGYNTHHLSPDSRMLALQTGDHRLYAWDLQTNRVFAIAEPRSRLDLTWDVCGTFADNLADYRLLNE